MIQQRVVQAYEEEKGRSKLPGYVPSYEDFEAGSLCWIARRELGPTVQRRFRMARRSTAPTKPPLAPAATPARYAQRFRGGNLRVGHIRSSDFCQCRARRYNCRKKARFG